MELSSRTTAFETRIKFEQNDLDKINRKQSQFDIKKKVMKPIKTTRQALTWLYIYPPENNTGKWRKLIYMVFGSTIFLTLLSQIFSNLAFVWKFIAIDFEASMDALYPIGGAMPLINGFVTMNLLKHRTVATFVELSNIYKQTKNEPDLNRFLIKVDEKCERACKLYFKYVIVGFGVSTVLNYVASILLVLFTHQPFNRDNLYLQYKLVLPWNQSTPCGYLAEAGYSTFASEAYLIFDGAVFLLFISLCLHYRAFGEIFQYLLEKLNDDSANMNKNRKILCDAINFQCSVRNLFFTSGEIFEIIITGYLMFEMVGMACVVYEMDLKMQHPDSEIVMLIIAIFVGMANLFVFCYFGKMTTQSSVDMADCAYDLDWYQFDNDLQKSLIPIIQMGQRPLTYTGYGIFTLNLETFAQLIKSIFSYFMFLKTLETRA